MRNFLQRFLQHRFVWFLFGLATIPAFRLVQSALYPTARDAMPFRGYYEEHLSLHTFLGDHEYSLKFPGDRQDFLKFVTRLGLERHKVSENEYRNENATGEGQKIIFDETDKLASIQYYSNSH
jgi:hypothetical protein